MKQTIIALLTTKINELEAYEYVSLDKTYVIKNLNIILDYVTDLQEEFKSKEIINIFQDLAIENEKLKKTIRDLEESCQYMCDVEKNQLEKMELIKAENEQLKDRITELQII